MRVGVIVTVVVLVVLVVVVKGYDHDSIKEEYKLSTADLSSFIEFHMRTNAQMNQNQNQRLTLRDIEADNECKKYGCALENEECTGNLFSSPNCTNNCCAIGLQCYKGKCVSSNFGASCSTNSDCYANCADCAACIDKVCDSVLAVGDSCKSDQHCMGNAVCKQNVCVGVDNGNACSYPLGECKYGSFCNQTTCASTLPTGSACKQNYQCGLSSVCSEGACVKVWSVPANGECSMLGNFSSPIYSPCHLGYYCYNGTCTKDETKDTTECKSNSDCSNSDCICDSFKGTSYCGSPLYNLGGSCGDNMQSVVNCSIKNQCFPIYLDYSVQSCIHNQCQTELNSMLDCMCPPLSDYFDDCLYYPYGQCQTSHSHKGRTAGIVIGILLALAIAGGIGYLVYKRRTSGYQPIDESHNLL